MKSRPVRLRLFNLVLFFSIIFNAAAENVFAQTNSNDKAKNYYSYSAAVEKTARVIKPRIYKADDADTKAADSKAVSAPKKLSRGDIEHRVFDLVNERRRAAGLPLLTWNDSVAGVARVHSENMATHKFFSHTGIDGKKVNNRADSMGVKKWRSLGENIAYNRGYKSPLESAVQSWMNSPGHRDNILKNDWQESGIGVVVTDEGTYYFTQVFLKK